MELLLLSPRHATFQKGALFRRLSLKTALTLLSVALLVSVAGAATVDFDSYTPLDACSSTISVGGLDFTGNGINCSSNYMYVWDGSSPNGNGTPALIFAGFGTGATMTMSLTGGGAFTLNSVDMTISWYDSNPSEMITANGNPIMLMQMLMTYSLNITGTSITFTDVPSGSGYWLMDNVVYNTTPEPGTIALLGSGMLAGIGFLRRKMM